MIADDLIEIFACPETHQTLRLADADLVAKLNERIAAGTLKNRSGKPVTEKLDGGLIREDGRILYAIQGDIPILLVEEGIEMSGPSAGGRC